MRANFNQSFSKRAHVRIMRRNIYTMEYYSAIKKNETMPSAATWMDLDIIILNEVSQAEKDKYHMISLIYGI